ncbi:MAG: cytochrome P450 [Gammaproteobacteria bacterium]
MSDPGEYERAVATARDADLARAEFLEHEFETYALMRRHVPIARNCGTGSIAGSDIAQAERWVLTRYDHCREVLRNPSTFSSRAGTYPRVPIPQGVDPPAHTAYRDVLNGWFSPAAMARLEDRLHAQADQLLDAMLREREFDFVAGFADPFPTVIFCELMGFPAQDYVRIMQWKNILMHAADGHPEGHALALARGREMGLDLPDRAPIPDEAGQQIRFSVHQELYAYFARLIKERRAAPGEDLISRMIAARYEGARPLSQEELEDTIFLLFMAGLDTVASALGLIIRTFAMRPDKRREFVALLDGDPHRLGLAIEELVRYHAIVILPRRVTRPLDFHGASFAGEDIVFVPTQAANRDPEEFESPDDLRWDRMPNRHMGFGLGPHRCLGIHLARRELRIALQAFHRRLPDYALHPQRPPVLYGGMKGAASVWLVKS